MRQNFLEGWYLGMGTASLFPLSSVGLCLVMCLVEMSALIARVQSVWNELSDELGRFWLLWRYRHHLASFSIWWREALKRAVDLSGGAVLVVVCAPIMALVAALIKLDSRGSIMFSQERVGRYGRPFTIRKFRTMVHNAESSTGPVWARPEDDPRVTRLGRFLRRTHLDELPQLFNVITGHMSLVGPRPERPCFVETLRQAVPAYDSRHFVKPGMTGLAQVHYRYDQSLQDVRRKVRFDLLYVRRMCLSLDLRILAWTMFVVVTGRGIR